jgi:pimeloyl-ACP methyl ester carboxylesterase
VQEVKHVAFPGAYTDTRARIVIPTNMKEVYNDGEDDRNLIVIPPRNRTEENPPIGVLIYCHGNFERAADNIVYLQALANKLNCITVGFEYPGYNDEPGKPSPNSINQALSNAFVFLQKKYSHTDYKYAVMGYSVGTGPTATLAANNAYKNEIDACILVAPYKSPLTIAGAFGEEELRDREWSLTGSMTKNLLSGVAKMCHTLAPESCREWWTTILNVTKLTCPLLVLHAPQDEVIPYEHGKEIAQTAEASGVNARLHTFSEKVGHEIHNKNLIVLPVENFLKNVWGKPSVAAAASIRKRQKRHHTQQGAFP